MCDLKDVTNFLNLAKNITKNNKIIIINFMFLFASLNKFVNLNVLNLYKKSITLTLIITDHTLGYEAKILCSSKSIGSKYFEKSCSIMINPKDHNHFFSL